MRSARRPDDYVVCLGNEGYPASLIVRHIYRVRVEFGRSHN